MWQLKHGLAFVAGQSCVSHLPVICQLASDGGLTGNVVVCMQLMQWSGGDLLTLLEERLDPSASWNDSLLSGALYSVANICSGSEAHKDAIMSSNIPSLITHHLRENSKHVVRVPALWCIINLLWDGAGGEAAGRCRQLRELGLAEVLQTMAQDASQDVRERVQTALEQLALK